MNKKLFVIVLLSVASWLMPLLVSQADNALNASAPNGLRPGGTLADEAQAPTIPATVTPIKKPMRNYPDQPPTIPHSVERYQLTKNFNQCLTCHSRARSPDTGAPMVSITHYLDRDHQVLAAVSPRRYFCLQCHVPQHAVEQATGNNFKGIDKVLEESQKKKMEQTGHTSAQTKKSE